jgi:hypothetical protein
MDTERERNKYIYLVFPLNLLLFGAGGLFMIADLIAKRPGSVIAGIFCALLVSGAVTMYILARHRRLTDSEVRESWQAKHRIGGFVPLLAAVGTLIVATLLRSSLSYFILPFFIILLNATNFGALASAITRTYMFQQRQTPGTKVE